MMVLAPPPWVTFRRGPAELRISDLGGGDEIDILNWHTTTPSEETGTVELECRECGLSAIVVGVVKPGTILCKHGLWIEVDCILRHARAEADRERVTDDE